MDLRENIEKQINAGFSREEIYQNLLSSGYTREQVDSEFPAGVAVATAQGGSVSTGSILLGILFVIVVMVRIARYGNSGSMIAFFSIFTGIAMAIYFFTKRG